MAPGLPTAAPGEACGKGKLTELQIQVELGKERHKEPGLVRRLEVAASELDLPDELQERRQKASPGPSAEGRGK